ncbi:MAG: EAL domain-containing protein [Gammaproteobacteria bacterium]
MESEKLLRLVIIEDSLNDAELLASLLRNAGHAIRPVGVEDEEQLRTTLKSQPLDLILCSVDSDEPSLHQVQLAISDYQKDIALIAVAENADMPTRTQAMRDGALDLVSRNEPDHLHLVIDREIRNLEVRRRQRRCESAVRETERRCHTLLDSSRDAITYVHDGMHVYANGAYLEMFGFSEPDDVEGMPVMDMVAAQDHGKFKKFLRDLDNHKSNGQELEVLGLRADGGTFNAVMEFSNASIDGEPCTQIVIRNQAVDKDLEKKLKFLSKQDLLTGLFNRQYFMEELERAVTEAAAGSAPSAVFYIEPDNFKAIKERVGIAGADLVLSDIAAVLHEQVGDAAVVARFADTAFTVLLKHSELEAVKALAEKICSAVENHLADVSGTSVATTCSIGLSLIGEMTQSAQEPLSQADLACEMARKQGGNRHHLHNPIADQKASAERDQQWAYLIRDALEHDRFSLVYQPIASLHGETSERYEVLVRMRDQDGKEVTPGQFIPVAEHNGLITAIDRWVINQALQVLSERRRGGHDTTLFLKLSADSLGDESLLPWISNALKKNRLESNCVVFEASEAVVVAHLKQARAFAKGVQELHCGFSLEHFGNGMNSFQLLKHIPVDYLKIDGSFMHNLASDQEQQAMVKSITEMAHSMGKTTIAEFVEDANSLAVLWQCGVNYIQGHFLQAPDAVMDFDFQGEEA